MVSDVQNIANALVDRFTLFYDQLFIIHTSLWFWLVVWMFRPPEQCYSVVTNTAKKILALIYDIKMDERFNWVYFHHTQRKKHFQKRIAFDTYFILLCVFCTNPDHFVVQIARVICDMHSPIFIR